MIAEYLEHALQFERMAAREKNPELKAQLEKQAAAYRKLAGERPRRPDGKLLRYALTQGELLWAVLVAALPPDFI